MKKVLIGIAALILLIILYGYFINPQGFKVNEKQVVISDLKESYDGFKIAQFSDLLLGSTKSIKDLEEIVKAINEKKPDIIVFTGDIFSNKYEPSKEEIDTIKDELKKLECTLYKYAVMGDNDEDNIDQFQEIMLDADFKILDNESTYLFYKDSSPIKITGLSNIENISKSLEIMDDIAPTMNLVLTHYPDFIDDISEFDVDLVLAGHSLNGQIRLPFFGGILKKTNAKNYLDSYYEIENTKMYVSSGLGTEKIKFRLFNKPEINIYRLKSNTSKDNS